ncbi:MAG: hypothetical protein QXD11_01460 [Candidatus Micrarchaeaceae archaeon]
MSFFGISLYKIFEEERKKRDIDRLKELKRNEENKKNQKPQD